MSKLRGATQREENGRHKWREGMGENREGGIWRRMGKSKQQRGGERKKGEKKTVQEQKEERQRQPERETLKVARWKAFIFKRAA